MSEISVLSHVGHNMTVVMCIFKLQNKLQCDAHFSIPKSILLSEKRLTALTQEA